MIRKIYTLLILGLCLGFAACGDDSPPRRACQSRSHRWNPNIPRDKIFPT